MWKYSAFVGFLILWFDIRMHGDYNVKFSNALKAKSAYNYRNIKEKLHKTIASIWFNKICLHI
jgi:hypothetical protein